MPAPETIEQFVALVGKSGLIDESVLARYIDDGRAASSFPDTPKMLARAMVRDGLLTQFQAGQLIQGKVRGFTISGKYKVLEHLGSGGMGTVYLCEHTAMHRRVALKVLPPTKAKDPSYVERFYREARAVAALDHPNIVKAHDIDHDGNLHFLVMEYVDGASLQDMVGQHGPLDPIRAAHYISQAAWGLQHAHEAGLVHRDIKPGNILVDRTGTVKVLDMGLARFFHNDDNLSKKYDETVLGTSDYLAPEQTLDSNVDIRADIYSLGATFYFCLTGQTIFGEGTAAQKLIWHMTRQPKSIRAVRPEVPEELATLVEQRLLAKDPAARFQEPVEICEALAPWTQTPIPPPPEAEMPHLCPAAMHGSGSDTRGGTRTPPPRGTPTSGPKRSWSVSGKSVSQANAALSEKKPALSTTQPPSTAAAETVPNTPPPRVEERPVPPGPRRFPWLVALVAGTVAAVLSLGGVTAWVQTRPSVRSEVALRPADPGNRVETPARMETPPVPAAPPTPAAEEVVIASANNVHRIHTSKYDAVLEADGNLTSLRVGGVEFLKAGVRFGSNVSRGSYFYNAQEKAPAVVKLPTIERTEKNVLKATGDKFTILYEFGRDAVSLKLTNATDYNRV